MAIANTRVLIKRSGVTRTPAALANGEPAYSYASNTLFIGTPSNDGVINIGGQFYTSTIDAATTQNTASTLILRNVNGAFYGRLYGLANTAIVLNTPQNFSITNEVLASAIAFDGSGAVALNAVLSNVLVNPGIYGGTTSVPTFTVAANGRITQVANVSIGSSSFVVSGQQGSNTLVGGSTLTIQGASNSGIRSVETNPSGSDQTITLFVDNTFIRANTGQAGIGTQIITSDLIIEGNVSIISGNLTSFNIFSTTIATGDSLIQLASNNRVGDVIDIGFYGMSNTIPGQTDGNTYHGLIRQGSGGTQPGNFILFKNLTANPTGNVITYNQLVRANLVANVTGGSIFGLANAIGTLDGGTGVTGFTNGLIIVGNGASALGTLPNVSVSNTGTPGIGSTVNSVTFDAYGRVTQIGYASIGGLTVSQGGTGVGTFATSGVLYGQGTSPVLATAIAGVSDQTFSNEILTVTAAGVPVWSTTVDGGQF